MIKNRTPMKRSGFASQWKPRPPAEERPERPILRLARVPKPSEPVFSPQPKATYVRDEDYRRAVASLPCARCGIVGFTQCCHSDSGEDGKGGAIKACDLSSWPGCGPRPGVPGCHYEVGHGAVLGREEKRAFEVKAAADTRAHLIAMSAMDARLRAVLVRVGVIKGEGE